MKHEQKNWTIGAAARMAVIIGAMLIHAGAATAERGATTAEADGAGTVAVDIIYFAEDDCIRIVDAREGGPAGIEGPQRTLVVTVTIARSPTACPQGLRKLERRISIADRKDALSVDIFFVDTTGKLIRSQRPRIYRDDPGERECVAVAAPNVPAPVAKC